MQVLQSPVSSQSDDFRTNAEAMEAHITTFREVEQKVLDLAEAAREKFTKRGKLLPRDRINRLLDRGTPFLELCSLAGYKMHDDKDGSQAGGGIIAGIGYVSGIRCLVVASNSAIKGGTITPAGLDKTLRLQQIAMENKLPVLSLSESGGANLNYATDIFVLGARGFANQARMSAAGIPQVTVVHGNATAGGAYQPGLSDYVIVIREQTKLFLAGPPLLKAATGEIATDEELGGAEMHSTVSGLVEYVAEDDAHAALIAREVVARLAWNDRCPQPPARAGAEPLYDPDEIAGIVPLDYRRPYEVREVIARIVDGSDFLDFKPRYGAGTVCVQAEIHGQACGILANNAPIDPDGATKATQFLQLCDQSDLPVVFLQNTTGYMVGRHYEQGGMIKHGSKMIQAVTNISVPRLTLMIGASYGAGNYGMCGRGIDPDFLMTWPNASTGVMGGDQAATTMSIVTKAAAKAKGRELDPAEIG